MVPISKIRGKQLATCVIAKTGLMLTICSYNPGILQCIVGFRKKHVFGTFDHQKFRQFSSKGSILTVHGRFCLNTVAATKKATLLSISLLYRATFFFVDFSSEINDNDNMNSEFNSLLWNIFFHNVNILSIDQIKTTNQGRR